MKKTEFIIKDGIKHKTCSKCGRLLPVLAFNKTGKPFGCEYRSSCRECQKKDDAKYREDNLEKERTRKASQKILFYNYNIKYGTQISEKWCPECERMRSAETFKESHHSYDNLYWRCAECQAKYYKGYLTENKEREAARHKRYNQTPKAIAKARARMSWRRSNYDTEPINAFFQESAFHHLHLRIEEDGSENKDLGIYIPSKMHIEIRHHPSTEAKPKRYNMALITAAAFTWLLSEAGLKTIKNGAARENLLQLIEIGKEAKLAHIPEKYREAHFAGITKLEKFLKEKVTMNVRTI